MSMTDEEVEELKKLAAQMYGMVAESEDIWECHEPTGSEEACPPTGCSDCGWCGSKLRDALLRLGVDI